MACMTSRISSWIKEMHMKLSDRLVQVRGHKSRRSTAKELGITEGTLRNYEGGLSLPNSDFIELFCRTFNVSPSWLILGSEGEQNFTQHKDGVGGKGPKPTISELQDLIDKFPKHNGGLESFATELTEFILIPMVDAVLAAGTGSLQTEGCSSRKYAFRSDFLLRKGSVKDMVIMRVEGDSMEPQVLDGDVVLIDQSQTAIRPSSVYAVGIEDAIYLKQIDAEPGKLILQSYNERYAPIEVDTRGDLADLVRIIGRIVWSSREW